MEELEVARRIRELITRLEICHFKVERQLSRILEAVGTLRLDVNPADLGQAHPRCGENAWRKDRTGVSRRGQEYIWALQRWLAAAPPDSPPQERGLQSAGTPVGLGTSLRAKTRAPRRFMVAAHGRPVKRTFPEVGLRRVPAGRVERVNGALGDRNAAKVELVSALVNRLLLRPDRPRLPPELSPFWLQVEATDICHYAFPSNLERLIAGIGRLEPVPDFVGCGSFDDARRELAQSTVQALGAWLRNQPSRLADQLDEHTPLKEWLAACLGKSLKELAHLPEGFLAPGSRSTEAGTDHQRRDGPAYP